MARIDDIPEPTRSHILHLDCAGFPTTPFVVGPSLARRRVAIVSSAAIHSRNEPPFPYGSAEFRRLPVSLAAGDIVMSHVSVNFDRSGFQRDLNVVYPIDRLRDLAAERAIGSVADTHFAVMGSTDPAAMGPTADQIAGLLQQDQVDAVLLVPV
ncbi:MAG: hypothetical protein KGL52_05895 [Rhodospirillales bacterium]|nr:hypothetical protein [Rhodospirillales bacterium]